MKALQKKEFEIDGNWYYYAVNIIRNDRTEYQQSLLLK